MLRVSIHSYRCRGVPVLGVRWYRPASSNGVSSSRRSYPVILLFGQGPRAMSVGSGENIDFVLVEQRPAIDGSQQGSILHKTHSGFSTMNAAASLKLVLPDEPSRPVRNDLRPGWTSLVRLNDYDYAISVHK